MIADLENRWRKAMPPFDGATVHPADFVPVVAAQLLLNGLVNTLFMRYGREPLFTIHDWHEHDGFINQARAAEWEELLNIVASTESMLQASTGEHAVRMAFFPESLDFLLRIYVPDIYDNPFHSHDDPGLIHYADFDLTCERTFAREVADSMTPNLVLTLEDAREFFDKRYAG